MTRKLTLLLVLFAVPLPAFASDGPGGTAIVGGVAALVLAVAVLVALKRPWGVAAAALLGIVVAGYLTLQHDQAAGASICNVSGTWNCDVVNRSAYSEIGGIPIALFGLAFYGVMAWLGLRHAANNAPNAPGVMTVLAATAVSVDLYLAWASSQLGAWCPLCVASWSLNLLLLLGSGLLWRAQGTSIADGFKAEAGSVAVVGLLTLIVGGMATRHDAAAAAADPAHASVADLAQYYEQVKGRIEIDGTEPVLGNPDAKFTLVEWADFECPHCALMAEELHKLLDENKDVKLLFKNYPISGTCNSFVEGERHVNACSAAAAGECARLQGKFWDLNRQMFKNQEFLGKEDIRFMINKLGIDGPAFETCMADPSTAEAVKQDVAAGGLAGVNGTPSIYLKGATTEEWVRVTGGRDAMQAILTVARTGATLPPARPPSEQ
jgi:protein-disulfide isomerase